MFLLTVLREIKTRFSDFYHISMVYSLEVRRVQNKEVENEMNQYLGT